MAEWSIAVVVATICFFNVACYVVIRTSRLLFVSHRKAGVPAAAAPLTWFAWDLVEARDLYAAPFTGTALLALYRALQFVVFLFPVVYSITVYQPAGGAFFLIFTNWTFLLLGFTTLLGAVLTAREARRQRRPVIPCVEPSQPVCCVPGATPGWSAANRAYHLLLETASASSIMMTTFYWMADYVPGSSVRVDDPFKHGVSAGLLLLDVAISRVPLVSHHMQVVVGYGSCYILFLWVYKTVTGDWVYQALDWSEPWAPAYYAALALLLILAFGVMFLVVAVREALLRRHLKSQQSQCGCLGLSCNSCTSARDRISDGVTAAAHHEFGFSSLSNSRPLGLKGSTTQLQELKLPQQGASKAVTLTKSACSSGAVSASIPSRPLSPTVAILMK